jgi:DNA-binding transcriptional LysR family regulator
MLRLEQLRYFVATVEKGSLNKAAKALFISQPALTKQLAQLEKQLSCVLFHRRMTGIELTEAGRFFYDRACHILEQLDQTVERMRQYAADTPLRIGALPSIANCYLPEAVSRLQREHQIGVSIQVRDTTADLVNLLERGMIDVAFVQDMGGHPEFASRPLFQEPYLAVLPASHPLASQETIDFRDLCRENMILHKDPCDIRSNFRRHCSRLGIQPVIGLEVDFTHSLQSFVAKEFGVTFLPRMVAEQFHDPQVAIREIGGEPFYRTLDVLYQPRFEKEVQVLCQTSAPVT